MLASPCKNAKDSTFDFANFKKSVVEKMMRRTNRALTQAQEALTNLKQ